MVFPVTDFEDGAGAVVTRAEVRAADLAAADEAARRGQQVGSAVATLRGSVRRRCDWLARARTSSAHYAS